MATAAKPAARRLPAVPAAGRRRLIVLGSTGSVGRQTLEVVEAFPDRLEVVGLAARADSPALRTQAERHGVRAPVATERDGPAALEALATDPRADVVVVASSGLVALLPTVAALRAGKLVALANKEVLVATGSLVMAEARRSGGAIVPVDSEHAAIWQCLGARAGAPCTPEVAGVERLILTASGGPFRSLATATLEGVTAAAALAHPTWAMGSKITIDSATLMNKGLELIEARWLFDMPPDRLDVVVHPQSVVHSMVEFRDGSILAQLASPDMRLPIQQALFWPERLPAPWPRLDWRVARTLTFEPPDTGRFPCLDLAREALVRGGLVPAALIGADDEAVRQFLQGRIGFTAIPHLIGRVLAEAPAGPVADVAQAAEVAEWGARRLAELASPP